MNKAEFAVCRIKEKLPGNQGFATKGSGCVVHCERLGSSWGWKCHYFIVTPSVVLCQEDLASDKIFVAEFLSKDKRGLETFEIKQMAEVCKDVVGRRLDNLDRDLYLTFISVEPLDKRGFLKKIVKKGSLETFRPLESFKSENKSTEELTEGLYCHVIVDLFHDRKPTNSAFSTQTYKLVYELETCEFSLQDFGGTVKTFNQEFPPIGAVMFTKKGEFAGLLRNFSNKCVTAIFFLPESSEEDNGEGEDAMVTSTGDETCVASNGDLTKPQINLAQESQPGSGSTTSGAVIVKKENGDVNRKEGEEESDNEDATQDGSNVKKQFQECPDHLIPNDRTEKVETENLLTSVNNATGESDLKEFEEKGGEICFDETEKSSNAVEESLEMARSFDEVEESLDKVGKHSDEAEAHEVEVVLCKSDKVSGKIEDPGELDEGIDEVAVGLCLKGESLSKVEEGTCVVGEGPCSTEELGLDAVKKSPGELEEGFAETQVDPCLEGGSLGKVEEGTGVVGGSPCSAEEGLDAVKESPGELEEGFAETQVDPCLDGGSLGKAEEGTGVVGEGPCSAEEGPDAVKESPGELEEGSHKMENVADSETTVSDSVMGTSCSATEAADDATFRPTIIMHDSSLTTVIQVCETSLQTESTEDRELEDRELEDNNDSALNISGNVSPESDSMITAEQSDIAEEQSFGCLPAKEDQKMMEPSIDNSVVNQENVISDSTDASTCTNSESTVQLVSVKPEDANQTDSIKTPDTDVAKETSEELFQDDELTLVMQDNQELSSISERTVNTIYDSCDISVCIAPPIEDAIETGIKDNDSLKEYKHSHDDVSEPSVDILTLSAEANDGGESIDLHVEPNENEVRGPKDSVHVPSDLEVIETEDNMEVVYNEVKSFDEHSEQYCPKLGSIQTGEDDEVVVTQKKFEEITAENGSIVAETSENSVHKSVSFEEKTAESCEDSVEMPIGGTSLGDAVVLQRVDADALLTETVTNNPRILGDLGSCLDTEYQYGRVPCWRDLAGLLAIAPEAYEHCGTFSATSPTEDLIVFLSATKPHLTIQDIKEALKEIDRLDVVHLLDRKIAGGVISEESVVGSLVERDDTDILGRMALKLDRKKTNNWKHLALQLSVPHRVLRNFGSHQRHNSTLMLLKYIPIYDPELTLDHLKGCLVSIGRQDAVAVLDKAGIPGDEPVKDILDDSDLLDQITDLLNDDPPNPHWRHLAKELKIPQEKCKIFEPTEDNNSPTELLFRSIENCEPDLTFEELVLALVAMKRQDVLDILQKYFSSDDIDQILEENNLLAPAKDASVEQKES